MKSRDHSKHVTDERINTITHLAAACFALIGSLLLIAQAISTGDIWKIIGLSVYSLSLITLFVFSSLHHGINASERVNNVLRTFDYDAVFFLIGGSITPIVLVLNRTVTGWSVLAGVWIIVAIGITLRSTNQRLPRHITNTLYIALGWVPVILIGTLSSLPIAGMALLMLGGVIYSAGFVVYILEKPNFAPGVFGFHEFWHILVVLAALTHYIFMYQYVLNS